MIYKRLFTFYQLVARIQSFSDKSCDLIFNQRKMPVQSKVKNSSDENPVWTGNEQFSGIQTFQMFWDSLVSKMMKAGCYSALEELCPLPLVGVQTTPAAIHRIKEIKTWKIEDQRCRGFVTDACPAGTPAGLFLHRWIDTERAAQAIAAEALLPITPITAERLHVALSLRFAPLNNLSSELRQREWLALSVSPLQPLGDYCDQFLFVKQLYDATLVTPVDDATALRRLTESLATNKEAGLETLSFHLSMSPGLNFNTAIQQVRSFDLTKFGQDRLTGNVSTVSEVLKCNYCGIAGHKKGECRRWQRHLDKKNKSYARVSALFVDEKVKQPYRQCVDCGGKHGGICYVKHPDKAPKGWIPFAQRSSTGGSSKVEKSSHSSGPGAKISWAQKQKNGKPLRNPRTVTVVTNNESDASSVSVVIVGSLDAQYRGIIAVDTGAQEDLCIINDFSVLETSVLCSHTLGTAAEGGTLDVSHHGSAGLWDGILFSSNLKFSVCSGGRLRAYGYCLVDSCPPIIVNRMCEPVLTGAHVKCIPTFSVEALFSLPRLPAITLAHSVPVVRLMELVA